jgi:hypothetical protein
MGGLHWGRFEWRAGVDSYCFEFDPGGLHATLKAPDTPPVKLPVVAWEGLLEAIKTSQKTRTKTQTAQPPRAGARWTDEEAAELARGFEGGSTVAELARRHARSAWAVESQLVRLGLMQRPDSFSAPPRAAHSLLPERAR